MKKQNRFDGRANAGILRPLSCEMSCLDKADGSAMWKSGSTHVLAAVYGPISPMSLVAASSSTPTSISDDSSGSNMLSVILKSGGSATSSATATVAGGDASYSTATTIMEAEWQPFLSNILASAIDVKAIAKNDTGRLKIQLVLHLVQANGSIVSCLLHAAVAALLDAGIELLYMPASTTCLVSERETSIRLDPVTEEECEEGTSVLVLVNKGLQPQYPCCGSHVVAGRGLTTEQFLKCLKLSSKACPAVIAFWRLAMEQKVKREAQTLWS